MVELDLWSVLGLRFQGFLLAAVLAIIGGASRWSSHEPELVAVAGPGYSSTTGGATFQISIGANGTTGCDGLRVRAAGGGDDTDASSSEDEGASEEWSVFPAPERVTTFTVRRSGWVVG